MDDLKIEEIEDYTVKEDYKFKIVIVGDTGVGKTGLVRRFIQNTFSKNTKATVGVEFISNSYKINNKILKIEIWDTAGQERYRSLTSSYYKGAKGAMIVYDVTNKISFENIDKWYNDMKDATEKDITLLIIGNKTDLSDKIVVSSEVSKDKAFTLNLPVMETSALNASNVKEAFYLLIKEIYRNYRKYHKKEEESISKNIHKSLDYGIQLNTDKKKRKKKCC